MHANRKPALPNSPLTVPTPLPSRPFAGPRPPSGRSRVVAGPFALCLAVCLGGAELSAQSTPRITVSWTEAPLRDVLRAFAVHSGRSIVVGAGVDRVFVTADIDDQPWDVALAVILRSRGLWGEEDEHGIIRVASLADLESRASVEPLVTRTYRVSYARASELQATLVPLLSERGSVSVLESANALVVTDIDRIQRVVAELLR